MPSTSQPNCQRTSCRIHARQSHSKLRAVWPDRFAPHQIRTQNQSKPLPTLISEGNRRFYCFFGCPSTAANSSILRKAKSGRRHSRPAVDRSPLATSMLNSCSEVPKYTNQPRMLKALWQLFQEIFLVRFSPANITETVPIRAKFPVSMDIFGNSDTQKIRHCRIIVLPPKFAWPPNSKHR